MLDIQKALNIQLHLTYQHLTLFCRQHPPSQVLPLATGWTQHPVVLPQYLPRSPQPFPSTQPQLCFVHHCMCVGSPLNQIYEHAEAKDCCFLWSPNPFIHSTLFYVLITWSAPYLRLLKNRCSINISWRTQNPYRNNNKVSILLLCIIHKWFFQSRFKSPILGPLLRKKPRLARSSLSQDRPILLKFFSNILVLSPQAPCLVNGEFLNVFLDLTSSIRLSYIARLPFLVFCFPPLVA